MTAFRRWRWWIIGAAVAVVTPYVIAQSQPMTPPVVPSFADLKVTTRSPFGPTDHITAILYLKGARQRHETVMQAAGLQESRHVTITQCDQQRTVQLNVAARLYGISNFRTRSPWLWLWSRPAPAEGEGAVVTTTFDAVDTGERRTFGHYVARRVRSTVTVEPSPGARTLASTKETDGWYIDVPTVDCLRERGESFLVVTTNAVGAVQDRHQYRTKRTAKRGYPIEQTERFSQNGVTRVQHEDTLTLIAVSEDPLDPSLFEIPGDYRPALPFIGGFDLNRPDTIANRLHLYSEQFAGFVRSLTSLARAGATTKRTP